MMVLFAHAFFVTVLELDNIGWVGVQCKVYDNGLLSGTRYHSMLKVQEYVFIWFTFQKYHQSIDKTGHGRIQELSRIHVKDCGNKRYYVEMKYCYIYLTVCIAFNGTISTIYCSYRIYFPLSYYSTS